MSRPALFTRVEEACICRVRGDPVVSDCDGQLLTLRGEGFFELATAEATAACPDFKSFIHNTQVEDNGLVIPTTLYIFSGGNKISIDRNLVVMVNDVVVTIVPDYTIPGTEITIGMNGEFVQVTLSATCDVEFAFMVENDLSKTYVKIPGAYFDAVTGVCGNFDGDAADDLALQNGTLEEDRNLISDSYKLDALPDM